MSVQMSYNREQVSQQEQQRRMRRKDSYYLVGSRNHLPTDPEEEEEELLFRYLLSSPRPQQFPQRPQRAYLLKEAKRKFMHALARSTGDVTASSVVDALNSLTALVEPADVDITKHLQQSRNSVSDSCRSPSKLNQMDQFPLSTDGMWVEISKPKFRGSLGKTDANDYLYTLGRMSFGIPEPKHMICSLQGLFNPIHSVGDEVSFYQSRSIPEHVLNKLEQLAAKHERELYLRTYDVVAAFTIEPNSSDEQVRGVGVPHVQQSIKGLMTTYGYAFTEPSKPNRLSICFTDGSIELVHEKNSSEWNRIFRKNDRFYQGLSNNNHKDNNNKVFVRVEDDGKISYHIPQPEKNQHVDLLYLDETLRIVQSSGGNTLVFARVPCFRDE